MDCEACNSRVAEFFRRFKKQTTSVILRQIFILLIAFKLQCKIATVSSETSDNSYQMAGYRTPDDLTVYGHRCEQWVTNCRLAQCLNFKEIH